MSPEASNQFAGGSSRKWVRGHVPHCLLLIVLVGIALRIVLVVESPRPWGYVWDRYDRGIRLLYENGELAESAECWQCYHPPVFYYAGLPFYWLGAQVAGEHELKTKPNSPLYFVGLLAMFCSAFVIYSCFRLLRFYKFQGDYLLLGFATAAIFPCLFISSWGIEADILLTALLCAFLFQITRYFTGPATASLWPIVRPAILAGLAAGTKFNGLLALIVGCALIGLKWRPGESLRVSIRDLGVFILLAVAIGGWKYVDNYTKYDTPLFANGPASEGFSIDKSLHWDLYDFNSLRLGEVFEIMSPSAPKGKLFTMKPYESVWTTLHALAWSDMSFFSQGTRHGGMGGRMYPRKNIPLWIPASVLSLALLPNALAGLGFLITLRRRSLWPLHILVCTTMLVYIQWVLSQTLWALKTKYLLYLLPAYLVYMCFGLQWIEKRVPKRVTKLIWVGLSVLLVLTHIYMFQFAHTG